MSGASQAVRPRNLELGGVNLNPPSSLIPSSPQDLTASWLENVLRRKHGHTYSLTGHEGAPLKLSQGQIGACSHMRCFTVRGRVGREQHIDHLIVKMLPEGEFMRDLVLEHKMSQRETHIYKDLLPALIQFEQRLGGTDIHDMIVPCHYAEVFANDDGKEIMQHCLKNNYWVSQCGRLVLSLQIPVPEAGQEEVAAAENRVLLPWGIALENYQKKGYYTMESLQLQKSQLNAAVRSLARMHATSFCWLQHTRTNCLPYLFQQDQLKPKSPVKHYFTLGMEKIAPRLLELGFDDLLAKLTTIQDVCVPLLNSFLKRPRKFNVLVHGDYRDGNLLLRETPDGDWQLRAVDWQNSRLGSPALDVLHLMLFSLQRPVMVELEDEVLVNYRRHFNEKLKRMGWEGEEMSLEHLRAEYRAAKLMGVVWAISGMQYFRFDNWAGHCIDIATEVDELGMMDDLDDFRQLL